MPFSKVTISLRNTLSISIALDQSGPSQKWVHSGRKTRSIWRDLARFGEVFKKGFNRQVAEPLDFIGAGDRIRTDNLLITNQRILAEIINKINNLNFRGRKLGADSQLRYILG